MRSIVAILLVLCVAGILLTPSAEDDVDGASPLSLVTVRGEDLAVVSHVQSLECSLLIASARQPKTSLVTSQTPVSVLRC